MKILFSSSSLRRTFAVLILLLTLILSLAGNARAGLNCEMNVIRYPYGFYFSINVTTNGVQDLPYGNYYFTSSGWPNTGDSAHYVFDATGFNQIDGGPYGYGDYASMAYQLTNGLWTAYV